MEYVTQLHTSADGLLSVRVPEEWADRDVTLKLMIDPNEEEQASKYLSKPQASLLALAQKWQLRTRTKYGTLPDSTPLIREDRDQRG